MNVHFFDCDETLWTSVTKDYISSKTSDFERIDNETIIRVVDNLKIVLRPGVREFLKSLKSQNNLLGIVSDNNPAPVLKALELFEILELFEKRLILVNLWDGYCPKHQMIKEGLMDANINPDVVILYDDKDYSVESKESGYNFVRVDNNSFVA